MTRYLDVRALPTGPFTTADALAAGLSPAQLRNPRLAVPSPGLRAARPPTDPAQSVRAVLAVLPAGAVLSHDTAARLLGLPLPTPWSPDEPVHVTHPSAQISRRGVVGHRASRPVTTALGLPVTTAEATWRDLAASLPPDDVVAVADAALHLRLVTLASLGEAAATSARGALQARAALALARPGAESPKETLTRLVLVRGGLPEPELNQWVTDPGGLVIGRVDMLWRAQRVVVEYEGDQHRTDRDQWRRDITRFRRLADAGYHALRVTAADLATPQARAALVAGVGSALARADRV